ncbi:MAG: aldolase [Chloroflexi bacterium]|nr:aldolase [Chloroflexota bacterium]
MLPQFQSIGRDLFARGLVSSHGGNMSIRLGDRLIITKHGAMLGHLGEDDLVGIDLEESNSEASLASWDLPIHLAIYKKTQVSAVLHAHPPHAISLSLLEKEIVPEDVEGSFLLGKVPVVDPKGLKTEELASAVAVALAGHKVIMVSGHGSFAVGQGLEEALQRAFALEESSHVLVLLKAMKTR